MHALFFFCCWHASSRTFGGPCLRPAKHGKWEYFLRIARASLFRRFLTCHWEILASWQMLSTCSFTLRSSALVVSPDRKRGQSADTDLAMLQNLNLALYSLPSPSSFFRVQVNQCIEQHCFKMSFQSTHRTVVSVEIVLAWLTWSARAWVSTLRVSLFDTCPVALSASCCSTSENACDSSSNMRGGYASIRFIIPNERFELSHPPLLYNFHICLLLDDSFCPTLIRRLIYIIHSPFRFSSRRLFYRRFY